MQLIKKTGNSMHPPKNMNPLANRIAFLDYLRIFAFMSVLVGHKFYGDLISFINNDSIHATPRFVAALLEPLVRGGAAGIVVFFLASGYIITFVLQTETPGIFLIKRIFRIYPLYMVAVLIEAATNSFLYGVSPDPSVLIPQLLLIGDFFDTPYSLGGVEWTLRVEVLFYSYMGILRYLNVFQKFKKYFPLILIITTLILGTISPIPNMDTWNTRGYTTIYASFLLLGSAFYLKEDRQISSWFLAGMATLVLVQYYSLISVYQPQWRNQHFATLSFFLFAFSWYYRSAFVVTPFILFLSEFTYSVYLFHNWVWAPIKYMLKKLPVSIFNADIQALFLLFLLCYIMLKLIEKPSIRIGRSIILHAKKKTEQTKE